MQLISLPEIQSEFFTMCTRVPKSGYRLLKVFALDDGVLE
jgi:hypothetical protein